MSDRPFKCGKCGNWFIKLPNPDGFECAICVEGGHSGLTHCHYMETSCTPSEVKITGLLSLCQLVQKQADMAVERIQGAKDISSVKAIMSELEQSFAKAELAQAEMPEILRWSTVMELPGMVGSPRAARFKTIEAIEELVGDNRRPPEDLAMLQRSGKVCAEIAAEIPALLSEARISLGQARQMAETWVAPTVNPTAKPKAPTKRRRTRQPAAAAA